MFTHEVRIFSPKIVFLLCKEYIIPVNYKIIQLLLKNVQRNLMQHFSTISKAIELGIYGSN